jgi:hypothetical protein
VEEDLRKEILLGQVALVVVALVEEVVAILRDQMEQQIQAVVQEEVPIHHQRVHALVVQADQAFALFAIQRHRWINGTLGRVR